MYSDVNTELTLNKDGYAVSIISYDDDGRHIISVEYYDSYGNPTLCNNGYFSWVTDYELFDSDGICIRHFYDTEGELTITSQGISSLVLKYDDTGKVHEESFYGLDGEPILNSDSYAGAIITYIGDLPESFTLGLSALVQYNAGLSVENMKIYYATRKENDSISPNARYASQLNSDELQTVMMYVLDMSSEDVLTEGKVPFGDMFNNE